MGAKTSFSLSLSLSLSLSVCLSLFDCESKKIAANTTSRDIYTLFAELKRSVAYSRFLCELSLSEFSSGLFNRVLDFFPVNNFVHRTHVDSFPSKFCYRQIYRNKFINKTYFSQASILNICHNQIFFYVGFNCTQFVKT